MFEIVLCVLSAALASVPLWAALRKRPREGGWLLGGMALCLLAAALLWPGPDRDPEPMQVPLKVADRGFVSSDTCRTCHPGNYASWHRTYHRTMTQIASDESVLAPFDGRTLHYQNRDFTVERRGDEFWVRMPDPAWEEEMQRQGHRLSQIDDPPMVERQIVMTTGSHHMQGYWVTAEKGSRRQFPWYYLVEEQRWVPRDAAFLRPPGDHRYFAVWDKTCIQCHTVAGNPDEDRETKELNSQVAELGISCESCHGPAEAHVAKHSNPFERYPNRLDGAEDSTIFNPAKASAAEASATCGQCHSAHSVVDESSFVRNGLGYRAGGNLEDAFRVFHFGDLQFTEGQIARLNLSAFFWDDGACRVGGDEYNGLVDSPCYMFGDGERQLSCLSCHAAHDSDPNDQLAAGMEGNQACLQCHESIARDLEGHTRHPADSAGSQCYNCHMPHTSYALYTAMRSHRVDNPDIASSARTGRPNACNLCHLDKSLQWAADQMTEWYGTPSIDFEGDARDVAASVLWLLKGNAIQRIILAWHMGWAPALEASGNQWQTPLLAKLLEDDYPAVRFVAQKALRNLPGLDDFEYDYLAGRQHYADAFQRAQRVWLTASRPAANFDYSALPLDAAHALDIATLKRLFSERDVFPAAIPE